MLEFGRHPILEIAPYLAKDVKDFSKFEPGQWIESAVHPKPAETGLPTDYTLNVPLEELRSFRELVITTPSGGNMPNVDIIDTRRIAALMEDQLGDAVVVVIERNFGNRLMQTPIAFPTSCSLSLR